MYSKKGEFFFFFLLNPRGDQWNREGLGQIVVGLECQFVFSWQLGATKASEWGDEVINSSGLGRFIWRGDRMH